MVISCVFRESKTFTVDYVRVFSNVFAHYHPNLKQLCFTNYTKTDLPGRMERIPLRHNFDSWFSKMELFSPEVGVDLFYSDLDNIIAGPLDEFFSHHETNPETPFLIKDVDLRQNRLQTAVMYIPQSQKKLVWDRFIRNSSEAIRDANKFGDAKIIRETPGFDPKTYQGTFHPNCIVSYRLGWLRGIQDNRNVKIVCQHGAHEKPLDQKFSGVQLIKEHFLKWK